MSQTHLFQSHEDQAKACALEDEADTLVPVEYS